MANATRLTGAEAAPGITLPLNAVMYLPSALYYTTKLESMEMMIAKKKYIEKGK
jgi:hypothetical protein